MQILMLVTDGYGCLGGIAQYTRDFLAALDASPRVERVIAWPRRIIEPITQQIPESVIYERQFAKGKWRYGFAAVAALLSSRRCDLVICAHLNLLPFAWLAAKRHGAALALIVYGIDAWRPTRNPITNFLARQIDHLISISRITDEKFRNWSEPACPTILVPPCVDLVRFAPGDKPEEIVARYNLNGRSILMTTGRLVASERYKGIDEIIELLPRLTQRLPNISYLVVGDGDDRERLQAKAATLGVADRVVFTGGISEDEKADHYRLADVFALPSRGEGFGIVLIEAASSGAIVVGSAIDGGREALLNGALGKIIDPAKREELYDALVSAFAESTEPRQCNPSIETFSKKAFERRVSDWLQSIVANN